MAWTKVIDSKACRQYILDRFLDLRPEIRPLYPPKAVPEEVIERYDRHMRELIDADIRRHPAELRRFVP